MRPAVTIQDKYSPQYQKERAKDGAFKPEGSSIDQVFFGKMKYKQALAAKFIPTDFISQNRPLYPIPKPV